MKSNIFYSLALFVALSGILVGCKAPAPPPDLSKTLLTAVVKGDTAAARTALEQGAQIEARNDSERTGLTLSALKGQIEMVDLFLEKGANLEAKDGAGMTPLLWACFGGNTRVVERLIEKGADIRAKDSSGGTALKWAKDHPHLITILKNAGAK
jgi:ankyrin repeat protein